MTDPKEADAPHERGRRTTVRRHRAGSRREDRARPTTTRRPPCRTLQEEAAAFVRSYQCPAALKQGYLRALGLLQECYAILRTWDMSGTDHGYLRSQLLARVRGALEEVTGFGRHVLLVHTRSKR
jgi:hypothetical protein